jgi:hypothetical protein
MRRARFWGEMVRRRGGEEPAAGNHPYAAPGSSNDRITREPRLSHSVPRFLTPSRKDWREWAHACSHTAKLVPRPTSKFRKDIPMIRHALLTAALVLAFSGSARAATLATAPFPGSLGSGSATCAVSNDGTKTVRVKIEIIDDIGETVDGHPAQTVDLLGGRTASLPYAALDDVSPFRCRFTASSKGKLRGSFIWISGTSSSPVIIPAQ